MIVGWRIGDVVWCVASGWLTEIEQLLGNLATQATTLSLYVIRLDTST